MRYRILFLSPYPFGTVGSQRFRYEQYLAIIGKKFDIDLHSFYSPETFSILYKKGHLAKKLYGFFTGFFRSLFLARRIWSYEFVFIHRGILPAGPPVLEWLWSKIFGKKIIFDFDDAIWLQEEKTDNNPFINTLKHPGKVSKICSWSYKVSCGNSYLAGYARQFNSNVQVIPTTIDTLNFHIPRHVENKPLVVGWTGTHTTLPYLDPVVPLLAKLHRRYDFVFKVICNHRPNYDLPGFHYVEWNKQDEIADLNAIDIGIMPLPDTEWAKGKCGFKILQYMSLEKATIASAVGVNSNIITHEHDGLLCSSESDWLNGLEKLLVSNALRRKLGKNGRVTVQENYSTTSNRENFLNLFS